MGFIVGLMGVEGSGKTTTAKLVVKKLKCQRVKAIYHHELNLIFLRTLFKLFNNPWIRSKRAENFRKNVFLVTNLYEPIEKDKFLLLTIYYFLVWLDKVFTYLYFKLKKGLVIFDRWPHEYIAHFQHIHYENKFIRKLFEVYPKPDVMVFLSLPAQVAYLRKRNDAGHVNHDVEYYRSLQLHTRKVAEKYHYDNIINSNRQADEVADDVLSLVRNFYQLPGDVLHGLCHTELSESSLEG